MVEHIAVKGYRLFRDFETDLQPGINLFVGANGSGKSTLVELLRIIQSCALGSVKPGIETRPLPGKVFHPLGEESIVWALTVSLSRTRDGRSLARCQHSMAIEGPPAPVRITAEALARLWTRQKKGVYGSYSSQLREALLEPASHYWLLFSRFGTGGSVSEEPLGSPVKSPRVPLDPAEAMLSRMTDPRARDSWRFRNAVLGWQFFSQLEVNRTATVRMPQVVEGGTTLNESGSNLSSVLLSLFTNLDYDAQREDFLSFVRSAVPEFRTLTPTPDPSTGQVVLQWVEREVGVKLSATDLSDGVLRVLMLGAICCNPHPPSLICIDEPEIGLHPKLLPLVGGLLRRAAERTQLIVLTHSPDLLLGMPLESIAVMRKREGEAQIVWPKDHDILYDILTEEVAGERELDRERFRDAFTSGELDELG